MQQRPFILTSEECILAQKKSNVDHLRNHWVGTVHLGWPVPIVVLLSSDRRSARWRSGPHRVVESLPVQVAITRRHDVSSTGLRCLGLQNGAILSGDNVRFAGVRWVFQQLKAYLRASQRFAQAGSSLFRIFNR